MFLRTFDFRAWFATLRALVRFRCSFQALYSVMYPAKPFVDGKTVPPGMVVVFAL